jgi:argininosuccinate lyase
MTEAVNLRERVKEPPSPLLVESYYRGSVARAQHHVFQHEMWVHLAHGLMLQRQGIIARDAMAQILPEILIMADAGPDAVPVDYRQEDLYSYVEKRIIQKLGPDIGGRLHTGRSRNDLNATTWRMALRTELLAVLGLLADLRQVMLERAEEHIASIMPGYTHGQHAQPITFGYWLASAADALARDHQRLMGAWVASALGFAAPLELAYDAVSSRDDALEAASAMAVMMTLLSRLATDLQNWGSWEYGFIELADRHSATSSIMPQKKNPVALEHLKAAAAMVQGAHHATMACTKNTAFADVNDAVTAVNEPVLDAALRSRRILALFQEVIQGLSLNETRMENAARDGFGSATELADVIVRETGLSFRMSHNIVAIVVRDALAEGRTAESISSAALEAAAQVLFGKALHIPAEKLRAALDPAENLRGRSVQGGPAPDAMAALIANRRDRLAQDRAAISAINQRLADARERCRVEAKQLAAPP